MIGDAEEGRITDESIEKMRLLVGFRNPTIRPGYLTLPHNTVVNSDAIRHYAELSLGDANPLYIDPTYGTRTRWCSHIAPPSFELTAGYDVTRETPAELLEQTRGVLRSVQLFNSGREAYYYRPISAGDTLWKSVVIDDVVEKRSQFGGRTVLVTNKGTWLNQNDETVAIVRPWYIHAERKKFTDDGSEKYKDEAPPLYTDEYLDEIEEAYDSEFLRGESDWFWEDVSVGDTLPRMAKGPLTITDQINMYMGAGWTAYGNPPYRLAYENRKRLRKFYTRNEFNAWDSIQRVHWDVEMAKFAGVKYLYDIGPIRFAWANHYCTNLIGDNGWLYRIRAELRRFNYVGDTTWISGSVTGKRYDEVLGALIEISFEGVNQRGSENMSGDATFLLPSRTNGPVRLPEPPVRDTSQFAQE